MSPKETIALLVAKRDKIELEVISVIYFNLDMIEIFVQYVESEEFSERNSDIFETIHKKYAGLISLEDMEETYWHKYDILELEETHKKIMKDVRYAKKGIETLFLRKVLLLKETVLRINIINGILNSIKSIATEEVFGSINDLNRLIERYSEETVKSSENEIVEFNTLVDTIYEEIDSGNLGKTIKLRNYNKFNEYTGGLRVGNLVGIAGAWKNGKTSVALNIILDLAEQGILTGVLSLEMSDGEIGRKIISAITNIDYQKLRDSRPEKFEPHERKELSDVNRKLPIKVVSRSITVNEVSNKIAELAKMGCKVIAVDYIGLIQSQSAKSWEKHNEISSLIKSLAKRHNVIIFLLAQLNREGAKVASSDNLADGIGLARGSDFFFTVRYHEVTKKFIVKLDRSRHSEAGGVFALEMLQGGRMNITDMPTSEELNKKKTIF